MAAHFKKNKKNKKPSTFIQKFYRLIQENSDTRLIYWNEKGTEIKIENTPRFEKEILIKYFKNNSIASLIRQLNIYGFKRTSDGRRNRKGVGRLSCSFKHDKFLRDRPDLRGQIVRQVSAGKKYQQVKLDCRYLSDSSQTDEQTTPLIFSNSTNNSDTMSIYNDEYYMNQQFAKLHSNGVNNMIPNLSKDSYTILCLSRLEQITFQFAQLREEFDMVFKYLQNSPQSPTSFDNPNNWCLNPNLKYDPSLMNQVEYVSPIPTLSSNVFPSDPMNHLLYSPVQFSYDISPERHH